MPPGQDPLGDIAAGKIAPVYFLCGEAFPRDRAVVALRRAVLGDGDMGSAFNLDAFTGKEATAARVLAAARTLPMMGDRRLVQVRDAHAMAADELKQLLPYLADPSPQTCLLLIADKADLRLKFFSALKKTGVLHRYEPLKERDAGRWLADEAQRASIKLRPGAAERIVEAVGADMAQLVSALDKLDLFVGGGRAIGADDVEQLLAQTRQRSIFELTNAVGRGDRREAMLVLKQMMAAKEPGLRIVAMLTRHLRQLWQARELSAAGESQNEIASAIGVHPFFVKDIVTQARRFDLPALHRTHRALYRADQALKSSRLPDALVMDRLVTSLCP